MTPEEIEEARLRRIRVMQYCIIGGVAVCIAVLVIWSLSHTHGDDGGGQEVPTTAPTPAASEGAGEDQAA